MTPPIQQRPLNGGSYIRHPDGSLTLEQVIDAPATVPVGPAPEPAPETAPVPGPAPEVAPPAPVRGTKTLKEV